MKNLNIFKRSTALLLAFAMLISCLPIPVLGMTDELSEEALRVSDEFAAQYPHGLLDIVNQNTITEESSGEILIYVARRGGTEGEVDVSVKAIEMTAKYGEDFVFIEEGFFTSYEVEKKLDTPTMLESSIADFGDEPVTIGGDIKAKSEDITDEAQTVVTETAPEAEEAEAAPAEEADGFDENREYASSLHQMRDEILNKNTKSEIRADSDLTRLFEVEDKESVLRDEAMSAVMPGAFVNLHFDDGENYKVIKIKIIDDSIVEAEEAFMLGLFDCDGAELGNNATSNVCIVDNEQKTEETKLYFEEEYISAYDCDSTVRLKVVRSNNIETYQLLQVQTMGNTAEADVNYSSLVTEAVLLAGQEYKYIDIPIKRAGITEPLDFEVRVSGAGCNDICATVTIYPDTSDSGIALLSSNVRLMAANDAQPTVTIKGNAYRDGSYADSGRVYKDGDSGVLELNSDNHRWGYLYYDVDLRGIEKVRFSARGTWSDTNYPSRVKHKIYIEGGSKTIEKQKNWGWEELEFGKNEIPHKQTSFVANADSRYWNDSRLWIDRITLYKQQITFSYEQPDTFKIPIYESTDKILGYYMEDGLEKIVAPQASISALNKETVRPNKYYRDDTVTLNATLSSDGKKYGAYLKGYELYNPTTGKYTYFDGTELTLTPEIIYTYVYGDGKTYRDTLKIKPVYGRRSVTPKLTVGNYLPHKGTMTFGGNVLNPGSIDGGGILTGYTSVWRYEYIWDDITLLFYKSWLSIEEINNPPKYVESQKILGGATYKNTDWCVGDYIAITLTPADGYTASAINDLNGNKISIGTSNTMYVQLKESGNGLFPVFNRNDCGVTFMYEGNTDGMYVFHDKKLNADSAFLDMLYRYTGGLTNWTNDEIPVFTGSLNNRIKQNYDMLRERNMLSGQKLSNLAIGDVVTVYAEAPDGYIPYWYVDDTQKTITTEGDKRYARHYGNSFSFEMTSNDVTLYCGMEKKTASDYVMTGKLVKPSHTLKGDGYAAVNPEIPASYMTVPGASLSVINFDERYNSVEIDGIKYYSSVISDADGNFKMYIPNVSNREYFSIKYANGVQTKATTLLAANGKTYYIVIPANDENYTVKSIDCYTVLGDMAENNGLIKIPYSSAGANRTFMVSTVSANENHAISAAKLNSYRKDGSRIVSINMTQSSAVGLETNWRANVNIAEILDDGGRITIELFDKTGNSRGEVESGYVLEKELPPANISFAGMPDEFSEKGLDNVPIIGNNVPTVPSSSFSEELDEKTMEIAVGQGETLKKAIYSQLEEFNNSDNWSKLMYLTEYISDTYSTNVSNSKTEKKDEDSGSGKNTKFPIMFDFGMYMKLDKNDDGTLSLNYVFVTLGLKAVYTAEWHWVIGGIPLYVTISAGGSVRGLIGINGTRDYFNTGNVKDEAFYALLGKYGQDEIANKHYDEDNLTDQKLFAALYNQSNLTKDKSQAADLLNVLFDNQKKVDTVNAIDALLNRYDFYYINEEIFEEKMSEFSYDLQNRINMYKQLVTVSESPETEALEDTGSGSEDTEREPFKPDFSVEYDATKVKQAWIHRFNMLLVLESLPKYLNEGKTTYDISSENFFGLGGADTPGGGLAATGIVTLRPSFAVGAGVGMRGAFSIGISGHIDFVINWQPWSEARGTVTFAVNADIDLLIIPLSVRLVGYTVEMFRTDGYLDNAFDVESGGSGMLMSLMTLSTRDTNSSVNTSPARRGGENKLEAMPPISLFSSYDDGLQYIETTMDYQTETTKHPQPEMYLLPDGNKLIIYMNDNLDRALYDRNSVYYSVFDKNTEEWSPAQELEEDGTLDGDIESIQLEDGRVIVVWTDSDRTFGDELPEMADLVTSQNISLCIFDEHGNKGDIHDITTLAQYGYSEPSISCADNALTIAYKITDYHTSGVEFDYNDIESTYQTFMSSSYESLAITEFDIANGQIIVDDSSEYALYEENSHIDLNGMRFVDTDIQGLENPKLYDATQVFFDGKTYLVYTMDTDNNASTKDDRELFCIIRENGENSKPVRLTDNNVNDSNANIVTCDIMNKIYFGSGSNICTIDLEAVTAENWEDKGSYCVMNNASQQSDSVLEYESEEAADGFEIFMGGDGMLYMLWTEFRTVSDEDGTTHKSRGLYMKAYDPMFITSEYEDEENGAETRYIGSWGLTNEVLTEQDLYINEPSLVVNADEEYSLAYRIFGMEELNDNGVTYEKEQDTSILCVSDFMLVSSISAKKTNQYPVYPKEGDFVSLDFECENYGVIPSDMIQFSYYIETDADIEGYDQANNCWWEKGDGVNSAAGKSFALIKASALYEGHMATGSKLGDSVQFIMPPFEKEVSIYVMAWEDDIYTPEISKIPVNIAPELEVHDLKSFLSDDETELTIQAIVRNTGNYPAENVVLKLNADGAYDVGDILLDNENTDFGENSVDNLIGEIEISALAPDETYELDYTIVGGDEAPNARATIAKKSKLTEKYFTSDGTGTFTVSADYDAAAPDDGISTFATIKKKSKVLGSTHTHAVSSAVPTLTNITVEDTTVSAQPRMLRSAGNTTVNLTVGEEKALNITLEPYGTDKGYSLIYESANDSVARINSSSGIISGISEGSTSIYVKAVKNSASNIVLVDTQTGDFRLNNGEIWDFENDTSTSESEVVMTKEIPVNVVKNEEITPPPTHNGVTTRYTITFETNGGSEIADKKVTRNFLLTEPTAPTKEGYIFAGWFTDEELTYAYDFDDKVTNNFTLYAKWEKQEEEKPEPKWENPFTDVAEDDWYYEDVKFVNLNKLMQGTSESEFAPNAELTRAMLVTVLWRMENEPVVNYIMPFEDVESESWYTEAVRWAASEKIVNGYSESEFAPNNSITREQIAAIMHRYAKYKEYDVSAGENTNILSYDDSEDISEYAVAAMQYAAGTGLIRGKTESTLNPADFATRAEIAAILHRFITSEK